MKKSIYIVMAFATVAIMLSGCEKKNQSDNQQPQVEKVKTTFTTVPQAKERTILDGGVTVWSENDKIKVFTQYTTDGDEFDLIAGAESNYAVFEGSTAEADTYYAAYPVNMVNGLSGSVISFKIPDTQIYNKEYSSSDGSFSDNTVPMVAKTTTKELAFKNVTGLLRLALKTTIPYHYHTIKSITITDNDSYLSGDFKVDMSETTPALTLVQGGGNTVSMIFDEDAHAEVSTYPGYFYFCLPVGALSGSYTIVITDSNDKVATIEWDASIYGSSSYNVELNQCKTMEETIEFVTPYPSIIDACGNSYTSVVIGDYEWLTENIHCEYDASGARLYERSISSSGIPSGTSCYLRVPAYHHEEFLYTWLAAVGAYDQSDAEYKYDLSHESADYEIQGVCPEGFHIATTTEYLNLISNGDYDGDLQGYCLPLKATDSGWSPSGWNDTGFNAMQVGSYKSSLVDTNTAQFWTATIRGYKSNKYYADYLRFDNTCYYTNKNEYVGDAAKSVRCVRTVEQY